MSTIAVVIATWAVLSLLSAVAGAFVAAPRNAPTCGAMAGLLLGPCSWHFASTCAVGAQNASPGMTTGPRSARSAVN
jgi:hypothetical protein